MIYVTHDQVEAMTLGERIVVFNGGRIEQVGTSARAVQPSRQPVRGRLPRRAEDELHRLRGRRRRAPARWPCACPAAPCSTVDGAWRRRGAGRPADPGRARRAYQPRCSRRQPAGANVVDAAVSHVEYLGDVAIVYASMPGVTRDAGRQAAGRGRLAPGGRGPAPAFAAAALPAVRCRRARRWRARLAPRSAVYVTIAAVVPCCRSWTCAGGMAECVFFKIPCPLRCRRAMLRQPVPERIFVID